MSDNCLRIDTQEIEQPKAQSVSWVLEWRLKISDLWFISKSKYILSHCITQLSS